MVFASTKAAKLCAKKYNNTSKMGNIMNVFVDCMGEYITSVLVYCDMFIVHTVLNSTIITFIRYGAAEVDPGVNDGPPPLE